MSHSVSCHHSLEAPSRMRTYFIAPDFDIPPPPEGPVQLGHIIPGPDEPTIEPINSSSRQIEFKTFGPTTKGGFANTRSKLRSGELGFWAQAASFVGVHVQAGFDVSSDCEINVEEVETTYFVPSDDYIRRSVATPEVKRYIMQTRNRVPLFMVVGIKIAKGASVGNGRSKKMGASAAVTASAPGVNFGPKVGGSSEKTEREGFQDSSDFVLALRLERIRFKKVGGSMQIRDHNLFTKGAKMMDGDDISNATTYEYDGMDEGAADLPGTLTCPAVRYVSKDDDGVAVRALVLERNE